MEINLKRLEEVLAQYEITIAEANDLVVLQDYKVVVVADDSTSMNFSDEKNVPTERMPCQTCGGSGLLNGMLCETCKGQKFAHYAARPVVTRWDEMKETLVSLLDIVSCIIPGGSDVYFLNGPAFKGVKSATDPRVVRQFAAGPNGNTPLTECLQKVVQEASKELPVLVLILTDGEPDGGPERFRRLVKSVIRKEITETTFKFQILACTDDHNAVSWLDKFDAEFEAVDVTDDYKSEKAQVLAARKATQFRRSDWIMKALLGPVSQKFDAWDEQHEAPAVPQCECCVM